jgi:hypothetical protein
MSSLKVHTIQSVATSAALYPVIGDNVIPFGLAVIFIDLDHLIEYVKDTKCIDVRGIFTYYSIIEKNLDKNYLALSSFHTVEFFSLVLFLSTYFPILTYVFAGMLWHMAIDLCYLAKVRKPFIRAYSIIEYIYRSRKGKYITSVTELVKIKNLNTSGIHSYHKWIRRWGIHNG